jgi:AraC-like DNA-binding protein
MQLLKRLTNFVTKFKDKFFIYKDGFFVLHYNAVSPQKTVDSFGSMPFNTLDEVNQLMSTKNPFFSGNMRYQKIEEGLWVYVSNLKYKAHLNFMPEYDLTEPEPFYMLNFNAGIPGITKTSLIYGEESEPKMWVLSKPNVTANNYHFKGVSVHYITVFFTEKWVKENIANQPNYINSKLDAFINNTDAHYLTWIDPRKYADDIHQGITSIINTDINIALPKNLTPLRQEIMKFVVDFIDLYSNNDIDANTLRMSSADNKKITTAEQMLKDSLTKTFPGVEYLAETIGMSPTKFKQLFKLKYGLSVYQYYQQQQMILAKEMLTNTQAKIGEVALTLGYENASKFSAAFKKHHGVLPSRL